VFDSYSCELFFSFSDLSTKSKKRPIDKKTVERGVCDKFMQSGKYRLGEALQG
jgi:hypothetical protein